MEKKAVYVDKTAYVYKLVHSDGAHVMWYAGIPYSITDKSQNGRSSESHQACLNGRVATDEDEVNEQFYSLMVGVGAGR